MKTFSEQGIKEHDEAIRLEAFEAGYTQGHNDTVESCVRDYKEAASDYILFAAPGHAFLYPAALSSARHVKFGNHGGLSADELDVPLFVVRP